MTRPDRLQSTYLTRIGDDTTLGLVIHGVSGEALLEAARAQRADPDYSYYPLFADRAGAGSLGSGRRAELDLLLDGCLDDPGEALEAAREVWRSAPGMSSLPAATPEQKLMSYLLLRPEQPIAPIKDWRSPEIYRYPLLEAFGAGGGGELLTLLAHRGVLARRQLIDRLRLCPDCGGAHILFVDRCPNCQRLEIQPDQSIHCFGCGHVESQGAFLHGSALTCPNCHTRLRQVGADYDRPLEHFQCHACGDRFMEPAVIARCGICSYEADPDQLVTREVGRYHLTEYGRIAARNGHSDLNITLNDTVGYLRPSVFEHLLDWQKDVANEHPQAQFKLLLLRIDAAHAPERMPPRERDHLLEELGERLPELTRPGDVCTRTRPGEFWILMPQADPDATGELLERIQGLIAETGPAADGLECQARMLDSGAVRSREEDGRALMERLRAGLRSPADA